MSSLVERCAREQPATLRRALRELPRTAAGLAARVAADVAGRGGAVRSVTLLGAGSSLNAALTAVDAFRAATGAPTAVHESVALGRGPAAPEPGPGDLLVAVSQSGASTATVAAAARAAAAGATAVLVTAGPAPAGVLRLDVACGPEDVGAKTKGYAHTVLALAALAAALGGQGLPPGSGALPGAVAALLADDGAVRATAAAAAAGAPLVLLSSGPDLGTVREGALKFSEITRLPARWSSGEEFLHGEHRTLTPATRLVVVSGPTADAARDRDLVRVLRRAAGHVLLVTGERRAGDHPGGTLVVPGDLPAGVFPVAAVVPLQLLALRAAAARGVDPDEAVLADLVREFGTKAAAAG
ncbi:SIS domain-containing protein [Kineococcus sp. SYSU DK005]|uniref:SIS domain-containing protein n=1 Tax=Kineococcus sp. SYSU DK005 TaxID=3383126 RepID=UPI003D7C7CE7